MAQKLLFLSLLVVCVTVLIFTWLTRGSFLI
ncbi:Hok/Gef family protein [Erwinia sp.]